MYLPKKPVAKRENPFRVQKAYRFFFSSGVLLLMSTITIVIMSLRVAQKRKRYDTETIDQRRSGKRIAIIGGGAAGCALASNLTSFSDSANVTVFEKQKRQTFNSIVPLANVGHRSYDLNTTGGIDFLRSPATWNVTREAKLVPKEIVRVLPEQNTLVADDGSTYEYDYLIIAAGAQRRLSCLEYALVVEAAADGETTGRWQRALRNVFPDRFLGGLAAKSSNPITMSKLVDAHGIVVNPGIMRDSLASHYKGYVVHVKVPPQSFVQAMEDPVVVAALKELGRPSAIAGNTSAVGHGETEKYREEGMRRQQAFAKRFMTYYGRQHDSTFVSSINTIWKYLDYFGKRCQCMYIAVTADSSPSDAFPASLNAAIIEHFADRNVDIRVNTYLHRIYPSRRSVVLKNYITQEETTVDYKVLFLDLPVAAPPFIRNSNLDATAARAGMQHVEWRRTLARWAVACSRLHEMTLSQPQLIAARQNDSEGFVDVDPETLQHRRYRNIFAIGDCAALPTVKSYGAVFAQAPIVSHNIRALIVNDELAAAAEAGSATAIATSPPATPHLPENGEKPPAVGRRARNPNARYNGYTSFDVIMTTWRAMWPEMVYNSNQRKTLTEMNEAKLNKLQLISDAERANSRGRRPVNAPPATLPARENECFSLFQPLEAVNNHLYDNLAWRDVRGFLNGFYIQSMLYELMFWFLFMRGAWHPPTWFSVPTFDVETGEPVTNTFFGL